MVAITKRCGGGGVVSLGGRHHGDGVGEVAVVNLVVMTSHNSVVVEPVGYVAS